MSESIDEVAERILAIDSVRDLLVRALGELQRIDSGAGVRQLLTAKTRVRQATAALDTYEEQIVERQRRAT